MPTSQANTDVLSWEQARGRVLEVMRGFTRRCREETVPLDSAYGRVLSQDFAADRDYPALRRSLRDGYAIHSARTPGPLRVRGQVRAGDPEQASPQMDEALEIMTGAPVPPEADAVLMLEHAEKMTLADGSPGIVVNDVVKPGQWINERGSEALAGAVLLQAGSMIDAGAISALAMTGHTELNVQSRPSVAILATGDELVPVDRIPASHQIRNSNSYLLSALVRASGGDPHILPIAIDEEGPLQQLLAHGLKHDVLLVSGGVSAGRYDLVKPTLRKLGVEFHFERVRIQPGGPCAFGTAGSTAVFGLPGNPGSTYVTFQLFAQLAIDVMAGVRDPLLPLLHATFAAPFRHRRGLTRFLPAFLAADGRSLTHIPWQGSSDIPALAKANAFLVADGERETWNGGDSIPVLRKL